VHDSAAFHETKLYKLLLEKKEYFKKHVFFLLAGDSAYCMDSFLLTPYSTPGPRSPEDAYNFYHSNCPIRIECTFGEAAMRFGIFWRTLNLVCVSMGILLRLQLCYTTTWSMRRIQ
jgi:hypothetical protein